MKNALRQHHTAIQTGLKITSTLLIWAILGLPGFAQTYRSISVPSPKTGYGSNPTGLIRDSHGNLYATNANGHNGQPPVYFGTVVEITASGTFRILHTFHGGDGYNPWGLLRDENGNLYGTTSRRGRFKCGSIFRLTLTSANPRP